MSDILCRWLNFDLRLSKNVEPLSLAKDFSTGYLLGEVLHRHQLQEDFHLFSKNSTANAKLNNFTRLEPTLRLLGVTFDLGMAKALMQGQQGAATRLLYQLYILLQKKLRLGLTGAMLETMQPAGVARLHRVERHIYTERLRTMVKREADVKMQKIAQRFDKRRSEAYSHSVITELEQAERRRHLLEQRRLQDIQKARRKQQDIMERIHTTVVPIPKPPASHSGRAMSKHTHLHQPDTQFRGKMPHKQQAGVEVTRETGRFRLFRMMETPEERERQLTQQRIRQNVHYQISEFEKKRRLSPSCPASVSCEILALMCEMSVPHQESRPLDMAEAVYHHLSVEEMENKRETLRETEQDQVNEEQMEEWNNAFVQKIRKRLEEDATAREQREKRRRRALIQQLHTHQSHEEMLREEQLIGRLMRQSQQERRVAVQLMQVRQQKEVLRNNRILRERHVHQQRLRDFQQALDDEAALLQQDHINREAELCKEKELHNRLVAERAQSKRLKHLNICREILEQIVDLATKTGEYRLLTENLIPVKLMREWKELWLCGKPLYELDSEQETELEKLHILNEQDYTEYTTMTGEWAWPEESKAPPSNNDILGHIVSHLRKLVNPPDLVAPPPAFPHHTLRACVLGKTCSGKTTCLTRISQAHCIHILSADTLIQEALEAHRSGKPESQKSLLAQCGAAVEEALKSGEGVPDHLLIHLITHAIRQVPEGQGWVLDGFPVELSQAWLLEKALGGADPHKDQPKGCELAVDRNAHQAPPLASPVLHLAVLLQLSDEKVLERHQQSVQERESVPENTVPPAAGRSQEQRQVQHRILGFQDSWPRLEEWFGVEQRILVQVEGDVDEDSVYRAVETVLLHAMDTAGTGSDTRSNTAPDETPDIRNPNTEQCSDSRQESVSSTTAVEALPPVPGSASWVYMDYQLPKEVAENLLSHWENMCGSYVSNVKAVMQNLRKERNLIIHHLYNIREEYKQYLMRPDLKQEFVCVWQHEYNSVSDDTRQEEETKSELHQRLEDLCERLWDICDKRKEEAMQEKAALTEDDWLETHSAVLINHYCTLIQVEVDRFQYTVPLLRGYYSGRYRSAGPEALPVFPSTTLPHINDIYGKQPEGTKSSADSTKSEKLTKTAGIKDTETEDKKKPRVPSSTDSSKQTECVHPEEKLLQDFHHTAVTSVTQLVTAEVQWLDSEELQEQIDREQEHTHTESHTPAPAAYSSKDKNKAGKKKGLHSPVQEPIQPPPQEEKAEEVQKRAVRNRMRQEYRTALQHEERCVCERIDRVKLQCVEMLRSLLSQAEVAYKEMEEWGGAHFLSEVNSVDQLAAIIRHHIENGSQITHKLTLVSSTLFIDGDTRVVVSPPPSAHPLLPEVTNQSSHSLTLQQLYNLHSHLLNIAPTGLVSCDMLCEVLTQCVGSDVLSEAWMQFTNSQECGMVDWRQFLLSAARPWPLPSQAQLINTLTHFREIDTTGGGVITLQQYLQVELWFPTQRELPVADDSAEPQQYDRLTNLRKFFFTLFSDSAHSPPVCEYMNMLLYFCAHPDPAHGFTRALSLVTQHTLRYTHTHTTGLLQSYVTGDCVEEEVCEGDEGGVSIDDLLRVVNLRQARVSSQQHTHTEELQQDLVKVFKDLGFKPEEKIPFHLLTQQSILQQLMSSSQYLLADFSSVLENQQGSSGEHPAIGTVSHTSEGVE